MINNRQELSGCSIQSFVCMDDEWINGDVESSSNKKKDSCWHTLSDNDRLTSLDVEFVHEDVNV